MPNGIFPAKQDRQSRLNRLETIIKGKSEDSTYESIIAKFAIDEGLSLRTIREYLRLLILAGKIDETAKI